MAKKTVATKKRNVKVEANGQLHVHSSFNNIIVSLANSEGQIIAWSSAGKMGLYTLLYYLVTSVLSVIIGIEAGKIFKPGIGVIIPDSLLVDGNNYSEFSKVAGFWETVENIISDNIDLFWMRMTNLSVELPYQHGDIVYVDGSPYEEPF